MKALIIDGYVDEPACLGVPPYLSPYPRYIAGALRERGLSENNIHYLTIDTLRENTPEAGELIGKADLLIIIAGMIHNVGMQTVVELYGKDPTQAGTVWLTIHSVFEGFAGANEAIGGIWILLLSWAALRTGALSKVLNYLGVVVGVAGIISIVPALGELFIYIFALGQIVWFIWLGIALLRSNSSTVAEKTDAFMSRHSTTNI